MELGVEEATRRLAVLAVLVSPRENLAQEAIALAQRGEGLSRDVMERVAAAFGVPSSYLTVERTGERVEAQLAVLRGIKEWDELRLRAVTGPLHEWIISARRQSRTGGGFDDHAGPRPICLRTVRTWSPLEDGMSSSRKDAKLWRRCEALVRDVERSVGIPTPLVPEQLIERLAEHRGRPIELRPFRHGEVPEGICGLWVDRADRDVIGYPTDARHRSHIVFHEVGHMLCGHRGRAAVGDRQLTAFMPDLDPAMIRAVLGRSVYTDTEEREAELIASLIMDRSMVSERPASQVPAELDPISQRLQRAFGG